MKEVLLRKALHDVVDQLKNDPSEDVRRKMRPLYLVAKDAIERCEKYQEELAVYKAPKLFDKKERPDAAALTPKVFTPREERIKAFLRTNPGPGAMEAFRKRNEMSEEELEKYKGEL
jgi:hypothetical protein